jgi:hypothetical protein
MRTDCALDHVGVHLDAAVIKKGNQPRPVPDRIAHRLGQIRRAGDKREMFVQPGVQVFHDRSTSFLSDLPSFLGGIAAKLRLDRIERGNSRQHLRGERGFRRRVELEEIPAHMRPAECQSDGLVGAIPGQPLETVISIDH